MPSGLKKRCSRCRKEKPITEFNRDLRGSFKVYGWCRACVSQRNHSDYVRHVEQRRASARRYAKKNPGHYLMRLYGITQVEYDWIKKSQGGGCAICGGGQGKKLSVDHNHATGKVRGLLCFRCNTGIGHFRESSEIILKAITYLSKHNTL